MIEEFINDKDDSTHIAYETSSLYLSLEDTIKALVDAVKNHAEN